MNNKTHCGFIAAETVCSITVSSRRLCSWFKKKKNHLLSTWRDTQLRWVLSTATYINVLMNRDPSEVWKRHLWRPHVQQRKSETAGVQCSVILYLRAAARGGRSRRAANYGNTIPDAAAAVVVEVQMKERFGSEKREQREWMREFRTSRWSWSKNNSYCHGWMMENRSACLQTANTRGVEKYMTLLRRGLLLPLDSQWSSQIVGWGKKKKKDVSAFESGKLWCRTPKHALRCLLRRMYSSHLICMAFPPLPSSRKPLQRAENILINGVWVSKHMCEIPQRSLTSW